MIKAVLHAQGRIPTPDVRLPLTPASKPAVDDALALLGERTMGECPSSTAPTA